MDLDFWIDILKILGVLLIFLLCMFVSVYIVTLKEERKIKKLIKSLGNTEKITLKTRIRKVQKKVRDL